jgi:hypothetical protein
MNVIGIVRFAFLTRFGRIGYNNFNQSGANEA